MKIERLKFGPGEMPYHAMHSADHLARYGLLRSICKGKRILDVACGEGYGSYLMLQWGADSVVGIDISRRAIAKAKDFFQQENVTFLVGDVCNLGTLLAEDSKFDIVCSFETIEHVTDPDACLRSLDALRSDSGLIIISAPNDNISAPSEHLQAGKEKNPFHLTQFTFASFKETSEAVLGPASAIWLGTPMQGYTFLEEPALTPPNSDFRIALNGKDAGRLCLIPPQANLSVDSNAAAFWVGIWGPLPEIASVASPLSMRGFLEPWQTIEHQISQIEARDLEIRHLENLLSEERRAALVLRQRLHDVLEARWNAESIKAIASEIWSESNVHWFRAIAREVWFEKQRWGLPYKIGKWLQRLLARRRH